MIKENLGRRDLLKLFSAGVIIVPAGNESVRGRLIEPPRVEIVQATVVPSIEMASVSAVRIVFEKADGSACSLPSRWLYSESGDLNCADDLEFTIVMRRRSSTSPVSTTEVARISGLGGLSSGVVQG